MQAEGIAIAAQHLRAARPQTMGSSTGNLTMSGPAPPGPALITQDVGKSCTTTHAASTPPHDLALRKDGMTAVSLVSDHTTPLHVHWRLRVLDMDGTPHHTDDQHTTLPP